MSEGSQVHLPFTFIAEGNYTLDVTTRDSVGSNPDVSNTTQIEVFEGVNATIISGPIYVKAGVATIFSVESHTGRSSSFRSVVPQVYATAVI